MPVQYLSVENVCKKLPTVVDPSYIRMLCDQGKIEHMLLPSPDGRKKDVCMIPDTELDQLKIELYGKPEEKTEDKTEPIEEYYTTDEVMEKFGFSSKQQVYSYLSSHHVSKFEDKGYSKSEVDALPEPNIRAPKANSNKDKVIVELMDEINRLKESNDTLRKEIQRIQYDFHKQSAEYETVAAKHNQAKLLLNKKDDETEDIESWKKGYSEGFADGFRKGGK